MSEDPAGALRLLLEGNERFISGQRLHPNQDADRRTAVAPAQRPFAVLFGCADSRLAAELIFDRGLGDLFVVRTAGHVVGPEVLGSIEYAVATTPSGYIRDVVERVMLSVLAARDRAVADPEAAVTEHIRYTVELLATRSAVIAERVADGRCGVVGLSYRLAEGSVRRIVGHGV
ncbi:MAG: carbonic anhydrase [Actinobacteria bacterium 13_1_20CM_3_71_11]|nr:MAG: carbonic anhydrase [Actinobacteria bacterium 13_1_20CM_3_71_11]